MEGGIGRSSLSFAEQQAPTGTNPTPAPTQSEGRCCRLTKLTEMSFFSRDDPFLQSQSVGFPYYFLVQELCYGAISVQRPLTVGSEKVRAA
jgi:hypothetical protein